MSSDVPEGAAPAPGRRPSRSSDGGAPVTGALTIVLAIVAVVAGFLILRSISNDDDGDDGTDATEEDGTTTTSLSSSTTSPQSTTTTTLALVTEGATVVVVNANGINGSAGTMSRELEAAGYTMGEPTNASATVGQLEETVVYFDPAVGAPAQAVAESVGRSLGGVGSTSPVGTPAPTESGELGGAGVLVMLGNDKAGKTLAELAPTGETATSEPGVTSPDPGTTTTTAG